MPADSEYSYQWARRIVDKWYDSHGRATELYAQIVGLTREQFAYILARRPNQWALLKRGEKILEKCLADQPVSTTQVLSTHGWTVLIWLKKMSKDTLGEYCAERAEWFILWEQAKEGKPERSTAK